MLTVVQPPDIDPPVISGAQASPVGDTDATISWTTDEDSDSQVFYRQVGESVYQQTALERGLVTSHSTTLTGLIPATDYEFHVRSADASGNVATSTPDGTFTTQANGFTYLRIEGETVTPSGDLEISLGVDAFGGAWINLIQGASNGSPNNPNGSWDLGFHLPSGGTWYFWYRMYGDGGCCDAWFESVDGTNANRIFPSQQQAWEWVEGNQNSLNAGLHAVTLGGSEALARIDRILITDDPDFAPTEEPGSDVSAPASATALVATPGDASVTLDWNNPGDPDVATVEVRYRTDGTFPSNPSDGVPAGSQPATAGAPATLSLSGLTNGTTYSFSVFVLDGSGNASAPATVQATPVAAPPPIGDVQNLRRTDTTGP
jgi:chitodextrinase